MNGTGVLILYNYIALEFLVLVHCASLTWVSDQLYRSQLLLLGKFEYGGGPIFKVVLEC